MIREEVGGFVSGARANVWTQGQADLFRARGQMFERKKQFRTDGRRNQKNWQTKISPPQKNPLCFSSGFYGSGHQ